MCVYVCVRAGLEAMCASTIKIVVYYDVISTLHQGCSWHQLITVYCFVCFMFFFSRVLRIGRLNRGVDLVTCYNLKFRIQVFRFDSYRSGSRCSDSIAIHPDPCAPIRKLSIRIQVFRFDSWWSGSTVDPGSSVRPNTVDPGPSVHCILRIQVY